MMNNNKRATLRRIGKERAELRRCPACKRGMAMRRIRSEDGLIVAKRCAWCKYEVVRDHSATVTDAKGQEHR